MNDKQYLGQVIDLAALSRKPIGCASILVVAQGIVLARELDSQRLDKLTASYAVMKAIATANKLLGRKLDMVTAYGNCERALRVLPR